MIYLALILLLAPLVGTLLLLYTQNNSKRLSILISNSSILISFFVSMYLLFLYFSRNYLPISQDVLVFADTKLYSLSFGLYIDSLSLVMSTVVTSVSFLVHYYSISYMKDESSVNRFFIYTNFFTFSMLLIVLFRNKKTIDVDDLSELKG